MKRTSQLALLTTTLLLGACSSNLRQAPIIDKPIKPSQAEPVRPATPVKEEEKEDAKGTYTIRKGDTLIGIALDHGLNYRDLAAWNNLSNPDLIKVGEALRLTQPEGFVTAPVPLPTAPEVKPAVAAAAAIPKKTLPRGEKKPYSEAALAEMQKDGAKPAEAAVAAAAAVVPPVVPAAPATSSEGEVLVWGWPSDGKVVATFDEGKNKGVDIAGKPGQAVLAAASGKVMFAGSSIRGYGNLVIVRHNHSLLSAYAHNRSIAVKEGQVVTKGEKIAEMGDSDTDSVKLHFEIRQQGKPVDPSKYLPSR